MSRLFAIDFRSLALLRIAIAGVLLYSLAGRLPDVEAMYTDAGIMPREVAFDAHAQTWRWSLHWLSGGAAWQWTLLGVATGLVACLLIGFQTRWVTLGSWILLASLHTRAPLLVSGGDVLLLAMLMWGVFLPWGHKWSLDAWRRPELQPEADSVCSVATACVILQVLFMYLSTALVKCNSTWFEGTALHNALSYDMMTRPLGQWLSQYEGLLSLMTRATLVLEFAAPLMLISPWGRRWLRPLGLAGLVGLHVGIELTMQVVIFSQICIAALTLFLPAAFWDTAWMQSLVRRLEEAGARLVRCVPRRAAKRTPQLPTASDKRPSPQGSLVQRRWLNRLADAFCLYLLVHIVAANLGQQLTNHTLHDKLPAALRATGDIFSLGQTWSMFSAPVDLDFRFVGLAQLEDGSIVDIVHRQREVDLQRPELLPAKMPNQRWMLAFRELTEPYNDWYRQSTAEYFYRRWNREQEHSVAVMELLAVTFPEPRGDEQPTLIRYAKLDALAQGSYRRGKRHGRWVLYHENGQKSAEGNYRNGRMDGLWRDWFPDGTKEREAVFRDGVLHGPCTIWLEDGTQRRLIYKDDVVVAVE